MVAMIFVRRITRTSMTAPAPTAVPGSHDGQGSITLVSPPAPALATWLRSFRPRRAPVSASDVARGAAGAFAGILVTALIGRALGWGPAELPWLVAPMGASSVLLFAVPASPLAQPWSIMGGNVSAGVVGIAAAQHVHDPRLAAAVGVSGAVAVMIVRAAPTRRLVPWPSPPPWGARPCRSRASPSPCGRWG
jgi:hypothetical protein